MKQFDIFTCHPPGWPEPHPCVVVSHPARADRKNPVEIVMCSSAHAGRKAEPHEIILDDADGMDWPTICKCDVIYAVPREELKNHRGTVSDNRRFALVKTIIAAHGWASIA